MDQEIVNSKKAALDRLAGQDLSQMGYEAKRRHLERLRQLREDTIDHLIEPDVPESHQLHSNDIDRAT